MSVIDLPLLYEASEEWCPSFPRKASKIQVPIENRAELINNLETQAENGNPGFVSAYAFPRGHSKYNNIPEVDTLFVDFDIEGKRYVPDEGMSKKKDWEMEMSSLLTRVRMFSRKLVEEGEAKHWRAALSGHKGIHLFLDFPAIDPESGEFSQFKIGLNEYANTVTESLDEIAGGIGIEEWVDVISADLGRLVRHPNTPHHGVAYTDEVRYCVPVSIEELAEINVEKYIELTSQPRSIPDQCKRNPSEEAGKKVTVTIEEASGLKSESQLPGAEYDHSKIQNYEQASNDDIEVEDLKLLTNDKPFVWKFRERDDAYQHGKESRVMELFIMLDFINLYSVPIETIVDFFRPIPGFREDYTRLMVKDVIARDYSPMKMETLKSEAPTFYDGSDKYT